MKSLASNIPLSWSMTVTLTLIPPLDDDDDVRPTCACGEDFVAKVKLLVASSKCGSSDFFTTKVFWLLPSTLTVTHGSLVPPLSIAFRPLPATTRTRICALFGFLAGSPPWDA